MGHMDNNRFFVLASYKQRIPRLVDAAPTIRQAQTLLAKYRPDYSPEWTLWVEELKGRQRELAIERMLARNPGEARWPQPVERVVERIWRLVEATYPDLDELNPVTVEHDDDRWTVGFTEDVILWGLNDAYVYTPWKIYLDTGKTKIKQTTSQVVRRAEQLIDPQGVLRTTPARTMPIGGEENPGAPYELRHYIVELTPEGDTKRAVLIDRYREWTHDQGEAMQIAGNLNEFWKRAIKAGASGGFEVVSEPVYAKNPPEGDISVLGGPFRLVAQSQYGGPPLVYHDTYTSHDKARAAARFQQKKLGPEWDVQPVDVYDVYHLQRS
jgi:hypothetical protein